MSISEQARAELAELAGRYPVARSALLPMLHLVQSEEGYVSPEGIAACAETLGLSTAEVAAVSTFYTMYKRRPAGKHHVGVCTNTLCALLGGDAVWEAVRERAGADHDEVSPDGLFDLERIECQAACTHAPVMTVDWEFFDRTTPAQAVEVLDRLAAGEEVRSTRGPVVRGFRAAERTISGIDDDGLAGDGPNADDLMLATLHAAAERGVGPADGGPAAPSAAVEGRPQA
ncbi:MAG: NAD(P)H-dependent oxidoreductase subunit E [Candidatus Nanopelagicales bacterium]|jgi:NADH-quinone oxidoreductase subunit E|nr:NAD(P)H-dependent oxidoreductase subunit E [Candidatus Nanopelagicales bacterium]